MLPVGCCLDCSAYLHEFVPRQVASSKLCLLLLLLKLLLLLSNVLRQPLYDLAVRALEVLCLQQLLHECRWHCIKNTSRFNILQK